MSRGFFKRQSISTTRPNTIFLRITIQKPSQSRDQEQQIDSFMRHGDYVQVLVLLLQMMMFRIDSSLLFVSCAIVLCFPVPFEHSTLL
jgi:hypothetical protein